MMLLLIDKKRKRLRTELERNEAAKMKLNILERCGTHYTMS